MEFGDDQAVIGAHQRGLRTGYLNRVKVDIAERPDNISFPINVQLQQAASAAWPPGTACFCTSC